MDHRFIISSFVKPAFLGSGRGRRLAALTLVLIALTGWSVAGKEIIATLNPSLKHELDVAMHPALDVWISPPDYADATPTIISTPAGVRFEHETLIIPEGSTISAHLAEQDGDAPELVVDGEGTSFTIDDHGDFAAKQALLTGKKLSIRRGWLTLASWKIKVAPDNPPQVALIENPTITETKAVRLSYTAHDDIGVSALALRITPHNNMPGANNNPVELSLPAASAKEISRVDFEDLTSRPWAGQNVTMQIVATNQSGKRGISDPVDFTLPERAFYHPLARVLIEERKKLLQKPDDEILRDEIANIMAGIAHETSTIHGDPVVMMALRSGAVRLILDHDHDAAVSVNDMLWETATRIEDGTSGQAQRMLRDARRDLANAFNRNAGAQEISLLTERLQQAMTHYMAWISARAGQAHSVQQQQAHKMPQANATGAVSSSGL